MQARILTIILLTIVVVGGYLMVAHADEPKEPVWGNSTNGIAIAVNCTKPQYVLGKEAEFIVAIKNVSNTAMNVIRSNPYAQYRMALFDQDGQPVAKSKIVIEEENRLPSQTGREGSRNILDIVAPGRYLNEMFNLLDWFNIDKAGRYQLVVMRQVDSSWDKGFAISNLAQVEITKPNE